MAHHFKLLLLVSAIGFVLQYCTVPKRATTSRRTPPPTTAKSTKEEALRQEIVTYARQYVGKKYQAAGKKPATGFDCSGFTSYVMDNFDIQLSPSAREQVKQGKPKPIASARPGDLVFFRRSASEPIFHVAMVVSNNGKSLQVIHSTTSRGVVIDDILASSYWKPKIDSVREVVR